MKITAEIISIGNELLSGMTINTNAGFIGENLSVIGIEIIRTITIPDTPQAIRHALDSISDDTRIVIVTGGLGPTPDDLTKKTIAAYFNTDLILHEPTLKRIIQIFEGRGMIMPDINRNQALIPAIARVIPNKFGTAPGLEIEYSNKSYFFLPGVPHEMKMLLAGQVLDKIKGKYQPRNEDIHIFRTNGLAESKLYEMVREILEAQKDMANIAFLPKTSGVDLRLQSKPGKSLNRDFLSGIRKIISPYVYSEQNESLPEVIGKLLTGNNYTLATGESFTGGVLSDWITDIAGCSKYFIGSVITYSDESKQFLLDVPKQTLIDHGAVSCETVEKMVRGVQKRFNTDCAIASTGIAGPTGATPDKPVGLCYLAAVVHDRILTRKYRFGKDRRTNKERGAAAGLELLRRLLIE